MTTTVLNTKIREVENEIPNHDKYVTTSKFHRLTAENFAARLEQANLVTKTDFDKRLTSFNRKFTSNKKKYFEVQKKLNSQITKDYNFFLDRIYFTSNDGSQNTFFINNTCYVRIKKRKGIYYILSWKSNGVYISNLKPLYNAFLHSIKLSGYKMGIKFDKDPLAVEESNYSTKIVNVYIVYDLEAWPRNPTNNFKFKNLFIWSN